MKSADGSATAAPISTAGLQALLDESAAALGRGLCVEGIEVSRRAIQQAIVLGDRAREASGLGLLARLLSNSGEYELTAAVCDQAAAILRELDDQPGMCDNMIVQALALHELGLSEEALDALDVAHEVANRLNDRNLLYWVHNRIAVVLSGMEDFARARDFQQRALVLVEGLDEDARFCILNNVADNAIGLSKQIRETGDWRAADQLVQDGLGHAEKALAMAVGRNPYREVLALDNSGMLLAQAGDHDAAQQRLTEALRLAVGNGYHSLELACGFHQATVLLLQDRTQEAIPALEVALKRAIELSERPTQLQVLLALSEALERTGRFELALRRHKQFVALERQLRSTVAATRVRMLAQLVDLETARLEAALARNEALQHRARTRELEDENRALERRTLDLDRRVNEDALTRLSNRHHLEAELPRLFAEAYAGARPLALVVLDIDHFKQVNDTFGHAVGDAVLVRLARLMVNYRRTGDLIGRMGGEEFLMALPGLDELAAVDLCQRLRRTIETDDWAEIRPELRVTVSLGVCARTDETDVDALVERADAAMYRAKRSGRNRVVWYADQQDQE
ncbi:MAG TPA: GGDEF domain-containing protein [Kineosporiaceae bacterium]|nr:GGDEF domain-containing protein [Kineosporiaceae bacterium]